MQTHTFARPQKDDKHGGVPFEPPSCKESFSGTGAWRAGPGFPTLSEAVTGDSRAFGGKGEGPPKDVHPGGTKTRRSGFPPGWGRVEA